MAYMLDEYERIAGVSAPGMITGKPIALGGSAGRASATAQGGVFALEQLVTAEGLARGDLRVAIQGFGNAGYNAAFLLHQLGYRIVALSDSRGGVYREQGIDPHHAYRVKHEHDAITEMYCRGSVCDEEKLARDGASIITNEEIITSDCDVLVPAALDAQIHSGNMQNVQARIVLELANGPTTAEAETYLFENGTTVIPDILANAGGVTVSYFEWVQNRMYYYWDEEEVHERLRKIMEEAFQEVHTAALEQQVSLRSAAYIIGSRRLVDSLRLRGRVWY
jgi:glutamate dehydrogenase (NADP+)